MLLFGAGSLIVIFDQLLFVILGLNVGHVPGYSIVELALNDPVKAGP